MGFATIGLAMLMVAQAAPQATRPMQAEVKAGVDAWQRGDFGRAVETWRKPAIAGDADAQFNLGQAYKLGRGVQIDLKQAEDWYRRAAAQGHAQAQDNYALILYQNGRKQEAMPLLATSAQRGEPRAQYVYGTELFNGELAPKDWPRAYAMMTRASAAGVPRASESLAQMDRFIPAAERQKGMMLAREMDAGRGTTLASAPPPTPAKPAKPPRAETPASRPTPKPETPPAAKPSPPLVAAKPAPVAPAPGGKWRVQLGAFGDAGRANALWSSLSKRVGPLGALQSMPVRAGSVTRLQAGPIASEADAERVCSAVRAARNPCMVVRP